MYNRATLLKKYCHYFFTSSNGKGHGIHSPFVFDFVLHVLNDKTTLVDALVAEKLRKELLQRKDSIEVEDFGAGSGIIKTNKRIVGRIAASSLKPRKYAALIARIARHYQLQTIVELGTSFGISTAHIGLMNPSASVFTMEGSSSIAAIARETFTKAGVKNIKVITGDISATLQPLLTQVHKIDLAFIDGNHRFLPVMDYFNQLITCTNDNSVIILDDVHWSAEMEEAWKVIKADPRVTLSIDLFFIGIVFFRKDFKVKQDYAIRF